MILDTVPAATLTEKAEDAFFAMAESMGILVTSEEAEVLSKLTEGAALNEQQNIVRLNRQSKLESLYVRSALVLAQQRKDPLFAKYARAAQLKRTLRDQIVKKYGSQAKMTARKLLDSAGKRNLVDVSARSSTFSNPTSR